MTNEGQRAAEEAESLLSSERLEERKTYQLSLNPEDGERVLEIINFQLSYYLTAYSFSLGPNRTQVLEASAAVLREKLQQAKRQSVDGTYKFETNYLEIGGFSNELHRLVSPSMENARKTEASDGLRYVAKAPLILNKAIVRVGGKDNHELRELWEPFASTQ